VTVGILHVAVTPCGGYCGRIAAMDRMNSTG
jgi:hypothetical protein